MSLFTVKASSSGERFRSSKPSKASGQSSAWLLHPGNQAFSFPTKQKLKLYDEPLLMGQILLCDHERSLLRARCENESLESNMILACSKRTEVRVLCADRKGVFDHLHPKRLAMSTFRVVIMQGTQVLTQYLNDQLKEDMKRDELVMKGKLSRIAADAEADEWAEKEWKKRTEAFPHRLAVAFAKFHSIILMMRFYEYVASKYVDKVQLDKLTMDTFDFAKRSANAGKEGRELAMDVYQTSIRANFISYLADYTVHQIILCFGYYVYIQAQRRQRKKLSSFGTAENDAETLYAGSLAISFTKNSVLLAISRAIGLLFSSIGGGLGAMIVPGWGSLAGANLGDALAMAVSDDFVGSGPSISSS